MSKMTYATGLVYMVKITLALFSFKKIYFKLAIRKLFGFCLKTDK
jgi:hypothetical protein